MDLSVILINWNGKHLLPQALASLPQQAEIWVVDNASQDGSVTWLKENYPQVNVIENSVNLGFARANNQALRQVTHDIVLMINSDAYIQDESLTIAMNWLKEYPQVGLLGAQLTHSDGRLQNSVAPRVNFWTECTNKKILMTLRCEKTKGFTKPTRAWSVIGAAMLARRQALQEIDFFDEDYFFFFEETDLCHRLQNANWEVWHHPDFQVVHAQGQSAKKRKTASRIEYHLSRELYFYKHFGRAAAKTLRLWQERRVFLTYYLLCLLELLSLRIYQFPRKNINRTLKNWYSLGCPENQGLRPYEILRRNY